MDGSAQHRSTGPGDRHRRQIRRFIQEFSRREGHPPSQREIADAVGLALSTVSYHVSVLQEEGSLRRGRGQPRTIVEPTGPPSPPGDDEAEVPLIGQIAAQLGIARTDIVDAEWADNGPGWIAILLASAQAVLDVRPGDGDLVLGLAGPYPPGSEFAFEVRAFFPAAGRPIEDPVTGSLNASLAQWLLSTGRATAPYVASQGTAIGRRGRVRIDAGEDGTIWVSGATRTRITGAVDV